MTRIVLMILGFTVLMTTGISAKETNFASSHYKYIALFEKETKDQQINSTMSLDDFREIIKQRWSEGYDISEIKYGSGKWTGVFTKSTKESHQTYIVADRWSAVNHILPEYWKKGYYITSVEHGLAEWIVVFEKNTSYNNQAFERRKNLDDFYAAVDKRWKEGFDLIDLEYGQGRWTGIFAEGTGYTDQAMIIRSRWSELIPQIENYWAKGYRISNIEFTLGKWMCIFSKYKGAKGQGYEASPTVEALKAVFGKRQKKGFSLLDLAEGW